MHVAAASLLLLAAFLLCRALARPRRPRPATPPAPADFTDLLERTSRVEWPRELNSSTDQISLDPLERPSPPPPPRSLALRYRKYLAVSPGC